MIEPNQNPNSPNPLPNPVANCCPLGSLCFHNLFKKPIFWIVLVLVLLAVIATIYFVSIQPSAPLTQNTAPERVFNPLPDNYQYTVMEKDKYPTDFPKSLMVKGGVWQRGEDTVTATGERLRIVELTYSSTTPTTLATSFQTNFEKAGWKTTDNKTEASLIVKTFTKKIDTVILTIVKVGDKVLANVTLRTK